MSNPSGVGVENNVVIFDDDPEEVKDSGKAFTDVVLSDGTGAQFNLAEFKGELANKQISDSGIVADNVVESSSSFTTDNLIIRSDGAGKNVQNSGITLTDADGLTGVSSIETAAVKITTGAGANKILTSDASGDATWEDPTGDPDLVLSTSTFGTDNLLIRSDGAGRNVQNSGITLTDTDGLTGVDLLATQNLGVNGFISVLGTNVTPLIKFDGGDGRLMPDSSAGGEVSCSAPLTAPSITSLTDVTTATVKITTGAGANKILTSDAVGDATWEDPSGGSRAAVQVRLTSNENLPGSLTDIEFDTIDIESDDSIIEVISDERIRVLQAGYYVVTFQGVFNPSSGSERELDIEIRKNGVLIPGGLNMTLFDESSKEDWTQISMEVIGLFAINDEISTAYEDSSGNIEIRANASMIVKTL